MKFTTVLLAVAGLVAAQDFPGQSTCIIPCLIESFPKSGCDPSDIVCACREDSRAKVIPHVTSCALSKCSPSDLFKAKSAAEQACAGHIMAATKMARKINGTRVGPAQLAGNKTTVAVKPIATHCGTTLVAKPATTTRK